LTIKVPANRLGSAALKTNPIDKTEADALTAIWEAELLKMAGEIGPRAFARYFGPLLREFGFPPLLPRKLEPVRPRRGRRAGSRARNRPGRGGAAALPLAARG